MFPTVIQAFKKDKVSVFSFVGVTNGSVHFSFLSLVPPVNCGQNCSLDLPPLKHYGNNIATWAAGGLSFESLPQRESMVSNPSLFLSSLGVQEDSCEQKLILFIIVALGSRTDENSQEGQPSDYREILHKTYTRLSH